MPKCSTAQIKPKSSSSSSSTKPSWERARQTSLKSAVSSIPLTVSQPLWLRYSCKKYLAPPAALRVQEKVLGKTHPETLSTIMNMAVTYKNGLEDITKAEEMYRQALDGYEKSLGKELEKTKKCARNLAILLEEIGTRKKDLRKLLDDYPNLEQAESWDV